MFNKVYTQLNYFREAEKILYNKRDVAPVTGQVIMGSGPITLLIWPRPGSNRRWPANRLGRSPGGVEEEIGTLVVGGRRPSWRRLWATSHGCGFILRPCHVSDGRLFLRVRSSLDGNLYTRKTWIGNGTWRLSRSAHWRCAPQYVATSATTAGALPSWERRWSCDGLS